MKGYYMRRRSQRLGEYICCCYPWHYRADNVHMHWGKESLQMCTFSEVCLMDFVDLVKN